MKAWIHIDDLADPSCESTYVAVATGNTVRAVRANYLDRCTTPLSGCISMGWIDEAACRKPPFWAVFLVQSAERRPVRRAKNTMGRETCLHIVASAIDFRRRWSNG
jgi:hypothetical protein